MARESGKTGVGRMVFIKSCRFDEAEIDLSRAASLAGPNNVGKTSAINALQFLFIGDMRQMQLAGKDVPESRQFYFPHDDSYLIFECRSLTGSLVTVGFRGLGPVSAYAYEIFAYPGAYQRDDFIDEENFVRAPEDSKTRVMARAGDYFVLDVAMLRDCVMGTADGQLRSVNLGLVPLAKRLDGQAAGFAVFRRLLQNLLNVKSITSAQLKQTLVDVHLGKHITEVDLHSSAKDAYARVRRQRDSIDAIRATLPRIKPLLVAHAAAVAAGRTLTNLSIAVNRAHHEESARLAAEVVAKEKEEAQLKDQLRVMSAEQTADAEMVGRQEEQRRAKGERVAVIEAAGQEFQGFILAFEQEREAQLHAEIDTLSNQIGSVTGESVEDLVQTQVALQRQAKDLEAQIEGRDGLLVTLVASVVGPRDAAKVAAVISSKVMSLGGSQFRVTDAAAFKATLGSLLGAVRDADEAESGGSFGLSGHGLEIEPGALAWSELPDLEAMQRHLKSVRARLSAVEAKIGLMKQLEAKKARRVAARAELEALAERARRWRDHQAALATLDGLRQEIAGLVKATAEVVRRQEVRSGALDRQAGLIVSAQLMKANAVDQQKLLQGMMRTFKAPDASLTFDDGAVHKGRSFIDLLTLYRDNTKEWQDESERVREILEELDGRLSFPAQYNTGQKVEWLRETSETIPAQIQAFQMEQRGLLQTVTGSIKSIMDGYLHLENEVAEFNRKLGTVNISNLDRVTVKLVKNHKVYDDYEKLVSADGLLGKSSDSQATLDTLHELIHGAQGKLTTQQLFELHFTIVKDGKTIDLPAIDKAESHGTMSMVKALLNMIPMRRLMQPGRPFSIPYYLDEALVLDVPNMKALKAMSVELGFTPIFAATGAAAAADIFYFVRHERDRAVIHKHERLERAAA